MIILSNFMIGFFCQIVYRSMIATVIGVAILLIKKIMGKKLLPIANYIIWLLFLIILIFPISVPSGISIYNFIDISDIREVENVENVENEYTSNLWKNEDNNIFIDSTINNNIIVFKNHIKKIIAFSWFIIFIISLIKRMLSYFAIGNMVENEEVVDERIVSILEKCKKKLRIRKNIKLIRQDLMQTPSTIGIFNVKILVNNSFLELNDISITDVFMHELSHYKRKDNVVNVIILVIKSLHWFNPFMEKMFKDIRNEMELAADQMAIKQMDLQERIDYCKTMMVVSTNYSLDFEEVLGLSATAENLQKRVSKIAFREDIQKNSKLMLVATIAIFLFLCLTLYPTSYGISEIPRLYLQLENGEKIEVTKLEENSVMTEVELTTDSKVKLVTKGGKPNDYIFYCKRNLEDLELKEQTVNISSGKLQYFERGEMIYKFTLTYGNNQNMDYAIKIIVK